MEQYLDSKIKEKYFNNEKEKIESLEMVRLIEKIFEYMNSFSKDKKFTDIFFDIIIREHPTLIQTFFRMINTIIVNFADKSRIFHDERDIKSFEWSKKIKELNGYFPLI